MKKLIEMVRPFVNIKVHENKNKPSENKCWWAFSNEIEIYLYPVYEDGNEVLVSI